MSKTYIDVAIFKDAGRKGGRATRDRTPPEERRARAVKAVTVRWAKYKLRDKPLP